MLIFRQDEFKEGLECAVCLCEHVEGEKVRLFPKCNHGFHVSSGGACLEEVASASSSSNGSSAMASTSGRQEGMLMIDVPTNGNENSPEEESRYSLREKQLTMICVLFPKVGIKPLTIWLRDEMNNYNITPYC
ncbi:hypothetical protein J1N35_033974 [Gossypium stocksii]|uniref:RING-type domain-containing protein n=1 Tax=Gossypium stocksii TaxID=47602 RepID=A0A9D3UT32_9ROSI|nr:hypothetical protein J1N35_033974 [Gossypium stocksii]